MEKKCGQEEFITSTHKPVFSVYNFGHVMPILNFEDKTKTMPNNIRCFCLLGNFCHCNNCVYFLHINAVVVGAKQFLIDSFLSIVLCHGKYDAYFRALSRTYLIPHNELNYFLF